MSAKMVMTKQHIQLAKKLLQEGGHSKRSLAALFGVGSTTIWQHVYSQSPREKPNGPRCKHCEIFLTTQIDYKKRFIPINYQIGSECLVCYLKNKGFRYQDLMASLDLFDILHNK